VASSGAKPSVGELVRVIVPEHLQPLKPALNTAPQARTEPDQPTLKAALGQLVEEHIRQLRQERVFGGLRRLQGRRRSGQPGQLAG
jgi:hypothetical protein